MLNVRKIRAFLDTTSYIPIFRRTNHQINQPQKHEFTDSPTPGRMSPNHADHLMHMSTKVQIPNQPQRSPVKTGRFTWQGWKTIPANVSIATLFFSSNASSQQHLFSSTATLIIKCDSLAQALNLSVMLMGHAFAVSAATLSLALFWLEAS